MKFIVEIGHPAHVHHFKHMYWELVKQGHNGLFVAKDKECTIALLKSYNLPYKTLSKTRKGLVIKLVDILLCDLIMFLIAKSFNPDIFISRVAPASAHVSRLLRRAHICFADTESSKRFDWIVLPGVDYILTSKVYLRDHGRKHIRYPGYHELAYLHPNWFTPDPQILQLLGLCNGERYAVVRFVSWNAHHDIGYKGLSFDNKIRLVNELSSFMKIFVSSEETLPSEIKKFSINLSPEYMHQVLANASLFVGESATMASESSCLGVPAVYINDSQLGYTTDLSRKGLLFSYTGLVDDQKEAVRKAIEIAKDLNSKVATMRLRDKLISDSIDVTRFMVWFIEEFPTSTTIVAKQEFNFNNFRSIM